MNKIYFFTLLFLIVTFTATKGQNIQQLGYYNINGISALSTKQGVLALGNGQMVNITNPSTPSLSGSFGFSGFSTAVLVDGDFSYYGTGMSVKLVIANISNPNSPIQLSSRPFPQTSGGIFGVAKQNNILYLAMGTAGVYSVDVSNPANPIVLDSLVLANGQSRDVVTQANYAFVAHGDGLKVIDISNTSNLNLITSIGSGYNSIDINNSIVFLGKNAGGIDAFDITDPINPLLAYSIPNTGGTAWDLKSVGNLVYLSTNNAGLFIYKTENNSWLEMANFPNTGNGQSFAVAIQDSLILLSGLINGVAILKYDSLGTPVGLSNNYALVDFFVYPNPTNCYLDFTNTDNIIDEIEITTLQGQRVYFSNTKSNRIDVSNLTAGYYTISIKGTNLKYHKKFLKIE